MIRKVRDTALLHPYGLPLMACLFAVSVVFTIFPQALEHTPVSFEERGIVHHVWHYALMVGSACALFGLFGTGVRSMRVELLGLVLLWGCLVENLIALVAEGSGPSPDVPLTGIGAAIRVAAIIGVTVRMYTVMRQPTVELPRSWETHG